MKNHTFSHVGFKSFILILVLLISANHAKSQVANYTFSQSNGSYTAITGGTVLATATGHTNNASTTPLDTGFYPASLPFNFTFNGTSYSSINVHVNGFITFGATAPTNVDYQPISTSTAYSGAIAAMSKDLWGVFGTAGTRTSGSPTITGVTSFTGIATGKPIRGTGIAAGATISAWDVTLGTITMSANATANSSNTYIGWPVGEIRTETLGTAPNRTFVIQYSGMADVSTSAPADNTVEFQIQLNEANGVAGNQIINIVYGSSTNLNTVSQTQQVGLRGSVNTDFNNRSSATDWSTTNAGTLNTSSITTSNTIYPTSGLTFTYTPPAPCFGIPNPGNTVSSVSSVCSGVNFTLSLQNNLAATGLTYQWEVSPDGVAPYTPILNDTLPTVTLSQSSSSYYRCYIYCTAAGGDNYSNPLQVITKTALSGAYTIDSSLATGGTNYQSFTSAITDLICAGVSGPVVFNVYTTSGTYTEQITIPAISGASATNTITFNGNGKTIQYTPISSARHIIKFNGADYIILKNLRIVSLDATYGWGIHLTNGSDHDSIVNCVIDISKTTSTTAANSAGIVASNSSSSVSTIGNNASYLTISNDTIKGGYQGIILYGNTSSTNAIRNSIINNTIQDFYANGIELNNNDSALVQGNDIHRKNRSAVGSPFEGVELGAGCKNVLVNANKIHDTHTAASTQTGTAYGVFSSSNDAPSGAENRITNNLIYNFNSGSGIIYGLYNSGSDGVFYYHNTIVLNNTGSTAGATHGFYQTTSASNIQVKNNIISITRGGTGAKNCLYFNTPASSIISNKNVLYMNAASGTNGIGYYSPTNYTTLTTWKTANSGVYDANSVSISPSFTSSTNFTPTEATVNGIGDSVGVTTDFTGTTRSSSSPDPGAYEWSIPGLDASISLTSPTNPVAAGSQSIGVTITNTQTITITSIAIAYTDGVTTQTETFSSLSIAAATSQQLTFTTPYVFANTVTMRAYITSVNGITDNSQLNDTVSKSLCVPYSGTYTINSASPTSGTNYQSFAEAIAGLACAGVNGPVVFNVNASSGPYTEQITIPVISGTSATNTITINGNGRTIQFTPVTAARHVIKFNGADYVTLNNLRVVSLDATYGWGIHLTNASTYDSIVNCVIDVSAATSTTADNSAGIVASNSSTVVSTTGNNASYLTIKGDTIKGGYQGIILYGNSGSVNAVRNSILNTTIQDFYATGVELNNNDSALVQGNDINRKTRVGVTTFTGVELTTGCKNVLVNANRIHDTHNAATTQSGTAYGVSSTTSDAPSGSENKVTNNLIYNFNSGTGIIYALYNSGSDGIYYYHNTVVLNNASSASGTTRGFFQTTLASNIQFKNNSIYITRGGTGAKHCVYFGTATSTIASNNNVLYINAPGGTNYIGYYSTDQATLANWQTANGGIYDANSVSVNPVFASSTDFTPTTSLVNNIGTYVGINKDILDSTRSTTTPDAGAYEFTVTGLDAAITWSAPTAPVSAGTNTISVNVSNLQAATITSIELTYTDGSTSQTETFTGLNIASGNNQNISFTTPYNLSVSTLLSVYVSSVNGITDLDQTNDSLIHNLCIVLAGGSYTINSASPTSGTNFHSFTDAVNRLVCSGINGAVVFDVDAASGPYTEQITIPAIVGASSINTITFNGNGRTLQYSGTTNTTRHGIKLDGADHIIIDNLTIDVSAGSYGWGVHFINAADSNTISNCIIKSSTSNTSSAPHVPIVMSASTSTVASQGNNGNYNIITGNTLSGGYYGVVLYGSSVSGLLNKNNIVSNNSITEMYSYGTYALYQSGAVISENDISRPARTSSGTAAGVYLSTGCVGSLIEKNRIHNMFGGITASTSTLYGIYVGADATSTDPNRIENNLIYIGKSSGPIYGIYNSGAPYMRVYHNTISLGGTSDTSGLAYGLYQTTVATGLDYRNNIITITRGGNGLKTCIYFNTATSTIISNKNVVYINSAGTGTKLIGRLGTTDYATLTNWQTANGGIYDLQSISVNPLYADTATGDYTPTEASINGIGDSLAITTDILNTTRSTGKPDPGAYEFTVLGLDASINWVSPSNPTTSGSKTITVEITNTQTTTINSLELVYTDGVTTQTETFGSLTLAPSTNQQFSFSVPYSLTSSSYLRAYITSVNGLTDFVQTNDTTAIQYICLPMSGSSYTINKSLPISNTNFQSFTDAINGLLCAGVNGAVVFNVDSASGPYTEQITIPAIQGTSSTNTITFNGNGGTLQFSPSVTGARHVIKLDGADHIIINNLVVEASAGTYGWGVHFINGADSNTISNCTINTSISNTTSGNHYPIIMSSSTSTTSGSGNNGNYNTITGNTLTGGYYSISLYGSSTAGAQNKNNTISNNRIKDMYSYAHNILYQSGLVISENDISRPTRTSSTTTAGVYLSTGTIGALVEKNRIHNMFDSMTSNTSTIYGVYAGGDGTSALPNRVYNNLIYRVNGNGAVYGIYNSTDPYMKAYHNTISLNYTAATAGTTYGIYQTGSATGIDFKNNIISITRGGTGAKVGIYFNTATSTITSDYNVIYLNSAGSGTQNIGHFGTTDYSTLSNWKTANGGIYDANSRSANPAFTYASTGDYTPTNSGIDNMGTYVGISTDIAGNSRSSSTPDVGAYEFSVTGLDAAVSWISPVSPVTTGLNTITVNIANAQLTTITSVELTYTDGVTPQTETFTGLSISAGNNQNLSFTTQYNLLATTQLSVYINSVNGVQDVYQPNDTLFQNICVTLPGGTYTINSSLPTGGTNFQSFTDATNALSCSGISGPIVLDVDAASGPYNEQITIPQVIGSSATNTITINGNGRTLQYTANAGARYVVRLDGADHVTIDNLIIDASSGAYGWGVLLTNAADSNTISNCTITTSTTSTASSEHHAIVMSGSSSSALTSGNNGNYNTITGNTLTGGYYCVVLYGASGGQNKNNIVSNNTIKGMYSYANYAIYQTGLVITGNDISRPSRTTSGSVAGVFLATGNSNVLIEKNRVHNLFDAMPTNTSSGYGFYVATDGTASEPIRIENNLVYNINNNGASYGIYNTSGDYMLAYHNTFSLDNITSTDGESYGLYQTGVASGIDFRNNIITIARGGADAKIAIDLITAGVGITSNNNVIHLDSLGTGAKSVGSYAATTYATLADWQTANGGIYDLNTVNVNPTFSSPLTNDYNPTNAAIDGVGAAVSVTTDIAGITRSATAPDPGAYEVAACTTPPTAGNAITSATGSVNVGTSVTLTLLGNTTGFTQTYEWESSTSLTGPYTSFSGPQSNPTFTFTASLTTLYYRCAVTCGTTTSYSAPVQVIINPPLPGGTYTINSALPTGVTNFQSFADAVDTIATVGIGGAVIFDVVAGSGPYNEQVIIPEIGGASALNTITFNGNGDSLTYSSSNTNERAVLKLNGADYITIDSLIITATGGYGFGIQLLNNADHNTIKNCIVSTDQSSTSSTNFAGILVNSSATGVTTTGVSLCDSNTIDNNTVIGGYAGIAIIANSSTSVVNYNTVTNNRVLDFYEFGIYLNGNNHALVEGNNISRPNRSTVGNFKGIYLTGVSLNTLISKNRLHNPFGNSASSSSGTWCIYTNNCDATVGNENIVVNNIIYDLIGGTGNKDAILNLGSNYVKYYNNTILLNDVAATCAGCLTSGFYLQSPPVSGLEYKNNIVKITQGGNAPKHCIYFEGTPSPAFISDYNDFYISSTGGTINDIGFMSGVTYPTLSGWQTASGQDAHSISVDPSFTSATDLTPTSCTLNNGGTPVSIVTTDILGTSRNAYTPDMGAIEYITTPTVTTPASFCQGSSTTIPATGANTLLWFTSPIGGAGSSLTVPVTTLPGTATYYIADSNTTTGCISAREKVDVTVSAPVWTGVISDAWNDVNNWSCPSLPTSATNVVISTGVPNMPVITDAQQVNDLTINTGASVSLNMPTSHFSIYGNITNNGTFSNADGKVSFVGTAVQTIPSNSYNQLEVNNSNGVSLSGNVTVNNELQLTSGPVSLNNDTLVIASSATISGYSNTNFVVTNGTGVLAIQNIGTGGKTGGIVFPVGASISTYNPVTIDNTTGTADDFNVKAISGINTDYDANGNPTGTAITTGAVNTAWFISEAISGGSNADVTVQWNSTDELSGFTNSSCYVSRYDSPLWAKGAVAAATGSNPFTQTMLGVTSFSTFGVGSGGVLPVQLISFTGTKQGNNAELTWTTASEINNDYFIVERSLDGNHFEFVANVKGNGTKSSISNYALTDDISILIKQKITPVYYRLKQVDMNGNLNNGGLIAINISQIQSEIPVSVQPNPFNASLSVTLTLNKDEEIKLQLTDMMGRVINTQVAQAIAGENKIDVEHIQPLQNGVYFINIITQKEVITKKVVKQN